MVAERIESRPVQWYLDRLAAHLRECNRRYPQAWRQIDRCRNQRDEVGGWAEWCFCPMSASWAIVQGTHGDDVISRYSRLDAYGTDERENAKVPVLDIARIAALSSWRVSQGVYLVDSTVLDAVKETPVDGEIPVDILMRLPEWCCYVPMPGHEIEGREIAGFFAHLEVGPRHDGAWLRLEVDYLDLPPLISLSPEALNFYRGMTFSDSYRRMLGEMKADAMVGGANAPDFDRVADMLQSHASERIGPLLSVLLYLCSQTAEFRAAAERVPGRPTNPTPKKVKEGWRLFPPDRPKIWCVGETIGKTIRDAMARHREHDEHRLGPRPHVRRAHWHSFWTGPRADPSARKLVLKWLPPMPVAMEEDTPEARMRRAKPKPIKNLGNEITVTAAELDGPHD